MVLGDILSVHGQRPIEVNCKRAHNLIKLGFVTNSLLVVRLLVCDDVQDHSVASPGQFPCLNFYWLTVLELAED